MMNEFEEMRIGMKELIGHKIALDYTPVATLLNALQTQLIAFKHNMIKGIQEVLPKIRSGGKAEEELTDLVAVYDNSPFSERTYRILLKTRKREIEVIEALVKVANEEDLNKVKVDIDGSGQAFECGLRNRFTVHYELHLLPYEDPEDFAQKYTDGSITAIDEDGKWFNNLTLSGAMGKMSKDFQYFAKQNKDRDICFVISLERGVAPASLMRVS